VQVTTWVGWYERQLAKCGCDVVCVEAEEQVRTLKESVELMTMAQTEVLLRAPRAASNGALECESGGTWWATLRFSCYI